jgi:hypothetical protein
MKKRLVFGDSESIAIRNRAIKNAIVKDFKNKRPLCSYCFRAMSIEEVGYTAETITWECKRCNLDGYTTNFKGRRI